MALNILCLPPAGNSGFIPAFKNLFHERSLSYSYSYSLSQFPERSMSKSMSKRGKTHFEMVLSHHGLSGLKLKFIQSLINTAPPEKFRVRAGLNNPAFMQHHDQISPLNRR